MNALLFFASHRSVPVCACVHVSFGVVLLVAFGELGEMAEEADTGSAPWKYKREVLSGSISGVTLGAVCVQGGLSGMRMCSGI